LAGEGGKTLRRRHGCQSLPSVSLTVRVPWSGAEVTALNTQPLPAKWTATTADLTG